jgi:hypothetical protein
METIPFSASDPSGHIDSAFMLSDTGLYILTAWGYDMSPASARSDTQLFRIRALDTIRRVSVEAVHLALPMSVYPNPTQSSITVSCEDWKNLQFAIVDMVGRTLRNVTATSSKTYCDLEDVPSGQYVLIAKKDGETISRSLFSKK